MFITSYNISKTFSYKCRNNDYDRPALPILLAEKNIILNTTSIATLLSFSHPTSDPSPRKKASSKISPKASLSRRTSLTREKTPIRRGNVKLIFHLPIRT
jgi:hypothetical protein